MADWLVNMVWQYANDRHPCCTEILQFDRMWFGIGDAREEYLRQKMARHYMALRDDGVWREIGQLLDDESLEHVRQQLQ